MIHALLFVKTPSAKDTPGKRKERKLNHFNTLKRQCTNSAQTLSPRVLSDGAKESQVQTGQDSHKRIYTECLIAHRWGILRFGTEAERRHLELVFCMLRKERLSNRTKRYKKGT